jgi:hypothetical protein
MAVPAGMFSSMVMAEASDVRFARANSGNSQISVLWNLPDNGKDRDREAAAGVQ